MSHDCNPFLKNLNINSCSAVSHFWVWLFGGGVVEKLANDRNGNGISLKSIPNRKPKLNTKIITTTRMNTNRNLSIMKKNYIIFDT